LRVSLESFAVTTQLTNVQEKGSQALKILKQALATTPT
jgi:hypothetical protein